MGMVMRVGWRWAGDGDGIRDEDGMVMRTGGRWG